MPEETDKILEAEASIQNIATELTRLRNAATLLENAQNQNESVLNTAETIVNEIQSLISTFKEVVSNLSSLNINQRLSDLEKQVQKLGDNAQRHAEETSKMIAKTDTSLDHLKEFTQTTAKNNSNAIELLNAGQEDIDLEVKKIHTVTKKHVEFSNSSMASTDEKLVKIIDLLVHLTRKRGLFSLFKRRKTKFDE